MSKYQHAFAKKPFTITELRNIPLLLRESGSGTLDVIAHGLKHSGLTFSQLTIGMEPVSTQAIKTSSSRA